MPFVADKKLSSHSWAAAVAAQPLHVQKIFTVNKTFGSSLTHSYLTQYNGTGDYRAGHFVDPDAFCHATTFKLNTSTKPSRHRDEHFFRYAVDHDLPVDYEKLGYRLSEYSEDGILRSVFKYARPQPKQVNEEAFELAGAGVYTHFLPYLRDCQVRDFDFCFERTDRNKSAGFPLNTMFENKGHVMEQEWYRTHLDEFSLRYETESAPPIFWNVCFKEEIKVNEKALSKPRTFVCGEIRHYHETMKWCDDFNQKFYNSHLRTMSFVGQSLFEGGWHEMIIKLKQNCDGRNGFENDESSYDASLFARFLWFMKSFRESCLHISLRTRGAAALYNIYRNMINTFLVMPFGDVFVKVTGGPSGSFNTIVDNTILLLFLFLYVWYRCAPAKVRNYDGFSTHVVIFGNGDDNLFSVSDEALPFFNNLAIRMHAKELGIECESPCDTPRPVQDCSFLSMNTVFDEQFRMFFPVPETKKVLACLLYKAKSDDVLDTFQRALSLYHSSYYNLELRDILRSFLDVLRVRFANRTDRRWIDLRNSDVEPCVIIARYTCVQAVGRNEITALKEDGETTAQVCEDNSNNNNQTTRPEEGFKRGGRREAGALKKSVVVRVDGPRPAGPEKNRITMHPPGSIGHIRAAVGALSRRKYANAHLGNGRYIFEKMHEYTDTRRTHCFYQSKYILGGVGFNSLQGSNPEAVSIPVGARWATSASVNGQYLFMMQLHPGNDPRAINEGKNWALARLRSLHFRYIPVAGTGNTGRVNTVAVYSRELTFPSAMISHLNDATGPQFSFDQWSTGEQARDVKVYGATTLVYEPTDPCDDTFIDLVQTGQNVIAYGSEERTDFGGWTSPGLNINQFAPATSTQSRGYVFMCLVDGVTGTMPGRIGDIEITSVIEFAGRDPVTSTGGPVTSTADLQNMISQLSFEEQVKLLADTAQTMRGNTTNVPPAGVLPPDKDVVALRREAIQRWASVSRRQQPPAGPADDGTIKVIELDDPDRHDAYFQSVAALRAGRPTPQAQARGIDSTTVEAPSAIANSLLEAPGPGGSFQKSWTHTTFDLQSVASDCLRIGNTPVSEFPLGFPALPCVVSPDAQENVSHIMLLPKRMNLFVSVALSIQHDNGDWLRYPNLNGNFPNYYPDPTVEGAGLYRPNVNWIFPTQDGFAAPAQITAASQAARTPGCGQLIALSMRRVYFNASGQYLGFGQIFQQQIIEVSLDVPGQCNFQFFQDTTPEGLFEQSGFATADSVGVAFVIDRTAQYSFWNSIDDGSGNSIAKDWYVGKTVTIRLSGDWAMTPTDAVALTSIESGFTGFRTSDYAFAVFAKSDNIVESPAPVFPSLTAAHTRSGDVTESETSRVAQLTI